MAEKVALYAVFWVPLGNDVVVTTSGGGLIVRLSVAVAFWAFESATCTLNVLVPLVGGVPEIAPELAANERPAGKLPDTTDHV